MTRIDEQLFSERCVMAPMAGVTDRPFRNLARELGAGLMVAEMLTSDVRLYRSNKSQQRLNYHDEPGLRWVQIAGAEPEMMAEAARFNADHGADVIDINMGCPAKKVCNKAAGSALLRDEALVERILAAVVEASPVPVTLKIRLGWCPESINAPRIASIAEAAGISALTVHGRTRACRFGGSANYAAIADVVSATRLPVVANGDITSPEQAAQVIRSTGAAAVMVGRAAQGRPWLPGQVRSHLKTGQYEPEPALATLVPLFQQHVQALDALYGHPRVARKHIGWYLDAAELGHLKSVFNRLESVDAQVDFIASLPDARLAA